MRSRIAVAIALTVLALTLVGCGGGEEATETPETTDQAATAPASTPAPAAEAAPVDLSPTETVTYEPFPRDPQTTPEAVVERLDAQQPLLVFFYDTTQKDTNDQQAAISAVIDDYRGAIDLVSFDVGKYLTTTSDGSVEIDPAFSQDPAAQQTAQLVSELGVSYTPYIVITDSNGYIIARFRGIVDDKTLQQEVLRATS